MGTAIKHPVQFLTSGHSDTQPYNPVRHMMLYSCTHMATVGVKGLKSGQGARSLVT